jgi:glycine oxidase
MARVVVVGGGVIGTAVAERLGRAGHAVVLLERDQVGAHASGAAAGLLAPHTEGERNGGIASLAMFPELAERLQKETGIDIEYRPGESLSPALDEREEAALRALASAQGGRWLDGVEAHRAEPALHPAARGAAVFAESQVTPRRLVAALARAAAARGAQVREGALVTGFELRGALFAAVEVTGERVPADQVVLAAGPWTSVLAAPLGVEVPVWPSRGQLVRLRPSGAPPLARMLTWQGRYLVPKLDGAIVAGSTEEAVGFDARVTATGVEGLLRFARSLVPALGDATVQELWAALRPATADGRAIVERSVVANVVVATGHNRNGILLAPATAERVAELIERG